MSGARLWLFPIVLLVTAALTGIATWQVASGIEADLTSRSQAALADADLPDGQVSFDGRDATLRGFPADKAQQAADTVRRVDGVRQARLDAASVPAPPPTSQTPPSSSSEPPSPTLPTNKASLQAEINRLLAAKPITFEPDTDNLTSGGERAAEQVAELIIRAPVDAKFQVEGHVARGPGGAQAALKLSQNRAKAAARLFIKYGVPAEFVTLKGYGDTQPHPGGEDRRVEITVK
jgi:outer membrane protein OmpA-like peptidoglycan-associated protein